MIQLPIETKKNGNTLVQFKRSKLAAIYKLISPDSKRCIGYEVFRIKSHNGREIQGNIIAPAEYMPSNEDFGTNAFYFGIFTKPEVALNQALNKFKELDFSL